MTLPIQQANPLAILNLIHMEVIVELLHNNHPKTPENIWLVQNVNFILLQIFHKESLIIDMVPKWKQWPFWGNTNITNVV